MAWWPYTVSPSDIEPVLTISGFSGAAPLPYPAVLKGGVIKQKIPPPVPPRGSPKNKRGGVSGQPSPNKGLPLSCCSTPPPPFEDIISSGMGSEGTSPGGGGVTQSKNQHRPAGSSRTNSASTTSSSASVRRNRDNSVLQTTTSISSVLTASSASIAAGNSSSGDGRLCWTPPTSIEGSTPTCTEGTPSFTESSSSGDQGCLSTPVKRHDGCSKNEILTDPGMELAINCLTTEMTRL